MATTTSKPRRKYRTGTPTGTAQPGLQGTRGAQPQGNMQTTATQLHALLTGINANCAFLKPWIEGTYALPSAMQQKLLADLAALYKQSSQIVQQLQPQFPG